MFMGVSGSPSIVPETVAPVPKMRATLREIAAFWKDRPELRTPVHIAAHGPGLAAVGPTQNYSFMPDAAKLILSFFMILGRLEFYAVVVLFTPRFWRS